MLSRWATNLSRRNIGALVAALILAKSFIKPALRSIKGEKRKSLARDAVRSSWRCSVANAETLERISHVRPAGNFQTAILPRRQWPELRKSVEKGKDEGEDVVVVAGAEEEDGVGRVRGCSAVTCRH